VINVREMFISKFYFVGWRNHINSWPGFWPCIPSFPWFAVQERGHQEADAATAAESLCLH